MKAKIPMQMTANQKKAFRDEVKRQILEHDREFSMESDAAVLWVLHDTFGFGKKRLRKFWEASLKTHRHLREWYQFNDDDVCWLYKRNLKQIGVDIEKWYAEEPEKLTVVLKE